MFRLIRTTTLAALRAELATARWDRDQAQSDVALVTDSAIRAESVVETQLRELGRARADHIEAVRDAARVEGELAALRAQVLLDTEDRAALRALLRVVRKQHSRADRVYALFRYGALHSVHATAEAAEAAAEAEGASPSGWTRQRPGAALPLAADAPWRVQPLPLGGAE